MKNKDIKTKEQKIPAVVILVNRAVGYYRGLLYGIAQYLNLHSPWKTSSDLWREPFQTSFSKLSKLGYRWPPDGMIITVYDVKKIKSTIPPKVPAIVLPTKDRIVNLPTVVADDTEIGMMAAEHLLSLGLNSFAYCGVDDFFWSRDRGKGFSERIAQAGFETRFYKKPQKIKAGDFWHCEQPILTEWLESLPKPIGLMACDDDRSQHVIEAAKVGGINVPDDIAVIGVDNDQLLCEISEPPISSVALNTRKAGYEAAELLSKFMNGTKKAAKQKIIVRPTHVEVRQSTNTLAIDDREIIKALRFIHQHANEIIQVNDVVNATSLSRRILERKFRNTLGRSILYEIKRNRMKQLSKMLAETNLSIRQIAQILGYPSEKHIARLFYETKGMSPLAYRKQYGIK